MTQESVDADVSAEEARELLSTLRLACEVLIVNPMLGSEQACPNEAKWIAKPRCPVCGKSKTLLMCERCAGELRTRKPWFCGFCHAVCQPIVERLEKL